MGTYSFYFNFSKHCTIGITVYDQYHHFNFSFVSIILENVDEF